MSRRKEAQRRPICLARRRCDVLDAMLKNHEPVVGQITLDNDPKVWRMHRV